MPRTVYLPPKVVEAISAHVRERLAEAHRGFHSAVEDEDTMTGHLFGQLRCGPRTVDVGSDQRSELTGSWTWSVDYTKFRGRGPKATESYVGADGIIELRLVRGQRVETKSLLFQSKLMLDQDPELVKQALLLSTWREAALIINFTQEGFEAISLDEVIKAHGRRAMVKSVLPLADALCEEFLPCKIGSTELKYDQRKRRLIWRDTKGLLVATQFTIPQRLRVQVQSPLYGDDVTADKEIAPTELAHHRLNVHASEIIARYVAPGSDLKPDPKTIYKQLSLSYHPDHHSGLEALYRDLANRRMQEVNEAYEEIRVRRKQT